MGTTRETERVEKGREGETHSQNVGREIIF